MLCSCSIPKVIPRFIPAIVLPKKNQFITIMSIFIPGDMYATIAIIYILLG